MSPPPPSLFDFDSLAATYDAWYETEDGLRHDAAQRRLVLSLLPPPLASTRQLLDVGCGTGRWSRFFAQQGYDVTGVDLSPAMIAVAKARQAPHCRFELADAVSLPFPSGNFDAVCALAVLEFVTDVHAACTEMIRCVNPGGNLIIGVLNRLAEINQRRLARQTEPYLSAQMFAPNELRQLLRPLGEVTIRETKEYGPGGNNTPGTFIVARVLPPAHPLALL